MEVPAPQPPSWRKLHPRRRWPWTRGDLLRALLFIPPAVYAALGVPGRWYGWRDGWVLVGWSIVGLAGLVWRGPKALIVPVAVTLAFALAAGSWTWPGAQVVVGAFAFTVLGIAAGLALWALYGALRAGRGPLPGRRQVLTEGVTLVILMIALIPVAFGTFGPRTTLAVIGLVVPPLAIGGIAAVRQPRHCWLLALETWLASLIPQVVAETRFPSQQPLAVVLFESLIFLVPAAWVAALLGKWLGASARLARGRPGKAVGH